MTEQDESLNSRAAVVTAGVVTNIIVMAPPGDNDESFELPDSEIILLTDDSPVTFEWLWDSGQSEFTSPPDE